MSIQEQVNQIIAETVGDELARNERMIELFMSCDDSAAFLAAEENALLEESLA